MTDEQLQRLLDALAGIARSVGREPWESWLPAVLALGSGLLGFGLSQAGEHFRRRRAAREARTTARREASNAAIAHALELAMSPAPLLSERTASIPKEIATHTVALQAADDSWEVADWWSRQMQAVNYLPEGGRLHTKEENANRLAVAGSISERLEGWVRGRLSSAAFSEENDAAWDEAIGLHSRTTAVENPAEGTG